MSQDHRQARPAQHPGLIQHRGETAAPHQPGHILRPQVAHVQPGWQLTPQGVGAARCAEDEEDFEGLALAVGQEKQGDGGVQRETGLLVLAADF